MPQLVTNSALPPGTLACERESGTRACWLRIYGELDLATAPQLELALQEAHRDFLLVVLEPRGLTFIDVAGLHVIIDAAARARRRAGWLLLVASSPLLDRLLALTGAQELVTVFDLPTSPNPLEKGEPDPRLHGQSPQAAGGDRPSQLGWHQRLRAVQDDHAEAVSRPSGVREPAWSRPPPGRDHATKRG